MGFSLFPKNDRFFELFSQSAEKITEAAEYLKTMVVDFTDVPAKSAHLKKIESEADKITFAIVEHLNASFITPIDREDIYALARNLDQVVDEIEGISSRLELFNIDKPTPECLELVEIIVESAHLVEKAVARLKGFSDMREFLRALHDLETKADRITRRMTAQLFHNGVGDILHLIKWKEIYARLEHTADAMEDIAHVLGDIVVKNG